MLNKILIYTVSICALLCSCSIENTDVYKEKESSLTDVEKFITNTAMDVDVPSNEIAIVRLGNDTLSITDNSKSVLVPNGIEPTIEYVSLSNNSKTRSSNNTVNNLEKKDQFWEVIAFEDSKNGDYDYNDLIVHVKYVVKNKNFSLYIQPVAYGATKSITLGFNVIKDGINIGTGSIQNTRENLFNDVSNGFINTEKYDKHYNGYTYSYNVKCNTNNLSDISIEWFIQVDGQTIYAVNRTNYKYTLDNNNMPYGLVLSNVNKVGYTQIVNNKSVEVGHDWFRYPKERVNIILCYDIEKYKTGKYTLEECILGKSDYKFDVLEKDNIDNMIIYELPEGFPSIKK